MDGTGPDHAGGATEPSPIDDGGARPAAPSPGPRARSETSEDADTSEAGQPSEASPVDGGGPGASNGDGGSHGDGGSATAAPTPETPAATAEDRTDHTDPVTTDTPTPEPSAPPPAAPGSDPPEPPGDAWPADSPPSAGAAADGGTAPAAAEGEPAVPTPAAPTPSATTSATTDSDTGLDGDTGIDDDSDDGPGGSAVVLGGAGTAAQPSSPAPRLSPDAVAASTARSSDTGGFRARITPPAGVARVGDAVEPAPRHLRTAGRDERRRPVVLLAAVPVLIVLLLILAWAVDSAALSGQVMRNVEVGGQAVGGLGEASLPDVMGEIAGDAATREVRIVSGDETYDTTAEQIGLAVDEEATAEAALDAGRSDPLIVRPFKWLGSFFGSRDVPIQYTVSEGTATLELARLQGGDVAAPEEPQVVYNGDAQEFTFFPGRNGRGINVQQVVAALPDAADEAESGPIVVTADSAEVTPQFTDEAAAEVANQANEMTAEGLTLTVEGTSVRAEPHQLREWIGPAPDEELALAPNGEKIIEDLAVLFAGLPGEPEDANVTLEGGQPTVEPSEDGFRCCGDDSVDRIWEALNAGEPEVTLEAEVAEPDVTTEEAEGWGIVEPVGGNRAWRDGEDIQGPAPGFTTFHAPGQARVTNIQQMARLVRGAVIPPGGSFSINDHVGPRTEAKGFVPAGAIAQGQHVDEVGGGVSQFATTLFNAAYFAGLDITTYQAHSEYFSRYPRGREATMGHPAPDLVIENDTSHGVLIWTSYTDTSLTVTLYSTQHITAEQTGINESPSGMCTNVQTTRTRTWPDGRTETDTFRATYRPGENLNCQGQPINPEPPEDETQ